MAANIDMKLKDIFETPGAIEVLEKHAPGFTTDPKVKMVMGMTLRSIQKFAPKELPEELINKIDADLKAL